jgi:hypothetical protein
MTVNDGGMTAPRVRRSIPPKRSRSHSHRQEQSRRRQRRVSSGTYRVSVSQHPETGKQRFAKFIARVLQDARDRGMNDGDITAATGVSNSAFHRWQRADFTTAPDLRKVQAFCEGLGVPTVLALRALGADEGRDDPAPEPAMDPNVRKILRALADPNVSDTDKLLIRETLKMLANRVTAGRRGELRDH